jgi:hypothetical protein
MPRLISIETTRYSEFFRRLLAVYADDAVVLINGEEVPAGEPRSRWCNNSAICATRDFLLRRHGIDLCGFHDHPEETWIMESELAFVERLAAEQIIRFELLDHAR